MYWMVATSELVRKLPHKEQNSPKSVGYLAPNVRPTGVRLGWVWLLGEPGSLPIGSGEVESAIALHSPEAPENPRGDLASRYS